MNEKRAAKLTAPAPPKIVVETIENIERPFSLLILKKASAAAASFEGERRVCIDAEIVALNDAEKPEGRRYVLELDEEIDPYLLAADIQAVADDVLRRAAIDAGLDRQEAESAVREARRVARIARRQLRDGFETTPASTCDFCKRTTAFVIDGVHYCKRHAEEHGVRPHGKIGGSEL